MTAPIALRYARVGGVLYIAIIVFGIWSDGFVRSALIVPGDPALTSKNILGSLELFRMSFVADTIMVLCDVALAVVLYVLLRSVNRPIALMAAAFRLTQAAVLGANLLNQSAVILVLTESGKTLEATTRDAIALLFAQGHAYGYDIGLLFFGINCMLTGFLVYRSVFLPRAIGVMVMASGPVYLVGSYLRFLAPGVAGYFQVAYLLPVIAELAFGLWLLIRGVDSEKWSSSRPSR